MKKSKNYFLVLLSVFASALALVSVSLSNAWKSYDGLSSVSSVVKQKNHKAKVLGIGTPVLSVISPSNGLTLSAGTTSVNLDATTDVPATCRAGQENGDTYSTMNQSLSDIPSTTHNSVLSPLKNDNNYTVYVQCSDDEGNLSNLVTVKFYVSNSSSTNTLDVNGPSISSLTLVEIGPDSAKFTWTSDKPTDTQIEYSANVPVYSLKMSSPDSSLTTSHTLVVTGLNSSVTYYFRGAGKDGSGNYAYGTDFSVTTSPPNSNSWKTANSLPPQTSSGDIRVYHVHPEFVNSNDASIVWETEALTYGQVEFGVGGFTTTTPVLETPLYTNKVPLLNLQSNTWYKYRVISTDLSGKTGMSGEGSFYTGNILTSKATSLVAQDKPTATPSVGPLTQPKNIVLSLESKPEVILPALVTEGDLLRFRKSSKVYLVKADGLHVFTSAKILKKYQKLFKKKIKSLKTTVSSYTVSKASATEALGW